MKSKWNKLLCLSLSCVLMTGFVSGCADGEPLSTSAPTATEPDPKKPLKVFTIGNSASLDDCHLLNLVAATEGYGRELYIGTLYHSGCSLSRHVENIALDRADYSFHLSSSNTPEEPPSKIEAVTLKEGLLHTDWDVIVLQGSTATNYKEASFTSGYIQAIQGFVNQNKLNPDAVYVWNMFQANPADVKLQTMYETQTGKSPEENNYKKIYQQFPDRKTLYSAITGNVEKYIITDSTISGLIPAGTVIENALTSYLEESDLHRDYVHLTDLGRVMAAYVWYCSLAGIEHLDQIKLNAIPVDFLKSTADKSQDRILTQAEKTVILESVNHALAKPLEIVPSQYTVAPAE